jgi:hypothetical protein
MSEHAHDEVNENGDYKRRCYCQKCVALYEQWCKENKGPARVSCQRKCITICEIECHKEQTTYKDWAFAKEYEGKWEPYEGKDHEPKHCGCGKDQEHCECSKDAAVAPETAPFAKVQSKVKSGTKTSKPAKSGKRKH